MYKEDMYILAYERIKSAPGNMTPGTDGKTIDGISMRMIQNIIQEMRTEQFQFKPVRTVYLPKPNGKKRRLGIPSTRDKIVQEVIRIILECIYDSPKGPYFHEASHGFRPDRSCHTALREIRGKWPAINWFLEGDIQSCFDAIDHGVLVTLLRKKIRDERFLNLIWKLLRAGYLDLREARHDSLAGTPQGGLASPILANVYLHELDEKVEEMRQQIERGGERKKNLLYKKLSERKLRLVKKGATRTKEFRERVRQIRSIPAVEVNDPNFIRLKYLRYADDWLVGICGPRKLAEQVKEELKTFLSQRLKLTLPRGKDEHHPCPQRAGPLSGNTISHWQRGHPTGGHDLQRLGAAYQTSLNGFGNRHDGPERGTHQEAPCQRILYCKRTTYHKARLDTPGCGPNHCSLQWH
jgi:group II intron reverse transcriptase/maturase